MTDPIIQVENLGKRYTLGGGLSWLGRTRGLAANSVLAIEVVTPAGVHRRVLAASVVVCGEGR